jgi:hypothetical protein
MLGAPVQVAAQVALVVQSGPAFIPDQIGGDGETDRNSGAAGKQLGGGHDRRGSDRLLLTEPP